MFSFIYLKETVHINERVNVNMPELAKSKFFAGAADCKLER